MLSFAGLLHWPDCLNVRDVGGFAAGDRKTRRGALVRADTLLRLTPDGVAALREYGVSRVLDLRASWEMSAGVHPLADDPIYRRCPFIDEVRDKERDPESEFTYADLYRGSLDRNGVRVAAGVAEIVAAPDGAVVVHCVAGADRTGMLVALVLDVLGVDRMSIMDDYGRTQECLTHAGRVGNSTNGLQEPGPKTILETLDFVDRKHGGPREYLLRNGITAAQLTSLRDRLLE